MDKLIDATTNPRDRAFIALLSRSGVRISEAIQIKESDVDFTNATLSIIHLKETIEIEMSRLWRNFRQTAYLLPRLWKQGRPSNKRES